MKNILSYVTGLFTSGKDLIQKEMNRFNALEKELHEIKRIPNKVQALVRLFQVISPLQDSGEFSMLLDQLKSVRDDKEGTIVPAMELIQEHIQQAGREIYGWNRTAEGEDVTAEKVYLGNVYGIWTKPASYWLEHQPELEKDVRSDLTRDMGKPVTTWWCISNQAEKFIDSHVDDLLKQIAVIKSAA